MTSVAVAYALGLQCSSILRIVLPIDVCSAASLASHQSLWRDPRGPSAHYSEGRSAPHVAADGSIAAHATQQRGAARRGWRLRSN